MRKATATILVLLIPFLAFSLDTYFSGETSVNMLVSVPPVEDAGRITSTNLVQNLELSAFSDTTTLKLKGGFSYNLQSGAFSPYMEEAYADLFIGSLSFRAGLQQISWGTAEMMSAVDVPCPSDMSDPVNMRKLAVGALKASYDAFPFAMDLYWIPVFTPTALPSSMSPGFEIQGPEAKLGNSEFAAKMSAYTSAGDFSLYGYYGWEDIPSIGIDFTTTPPTPYGEYDRLMMLGASAAVPVGQVTLKGEAAWYPERDAVASASAGLEWIHDDLTLITEAYGEWNKEDESLSGQFGASISYDLLDSDLQINLSGIVEIEKWDGLAEFGVECSITDELSISADLVYAFEGPDEAGTYGAFKDLDCLALQLTYSF